LGCVQVFAESGEYVLLLRCRHESLCTGLGAIVQSKICIKLYKICLNFQPHSIFVVSGFIQNLEKQFGKAARKI
jgi:hypothetical protein